MGVPFALDQECESGLLSSIFILVHLHLADVEFISSFGQRVLCLPHCSGQRYDGEDIKMDRLIDLWPFFLCL